jgi:hypothetical protein
LSGEGNGGRDGAGHVDLLLALRTKKSPITTDDLEDIRAIYIIYARRFPIQALLQLTGASHTLFYKYYGEQKAIVGAADMAVRRFGERYPDPRDVQIEELRREIVAMTAHNTAQEDQLKKAREDLAAAKSARTAEVQKTRAARAIEQRLRYIINKVSKESHRAVAGSETLQRALVIATSEAQTMQNEAAKLAVDLEKALGIIGVDERLLARARGIEVKYNAILDKHRVMEKKFPALADLAEFVSLDDKHPGCRVETSPDADMIITSYDALCVTPHVALGQQTGVISGLGRPAPEMLQHIMSQFSDPHHALKCDRYAIIKIEGAVILQRWLSSMLE